MPRHVGIIMDGNGRWANTRGWRRLQGHVQGADQVMSVIEESIALDVRALSLFCFSTENWKRPSEEVDFLMDLMYRFADRQIDRLYELNVKVRVFGEYHRAPPRLQRQLDRSVEKTKDNTGLALNFMVSYGGRLDILRATKAIAEKVRAGVLQPEEITEEVFSRHLYTNEIPDPDLIIRTSGEFRVSNFMLWQSAYAEFFVSEKFWPDFTRQDFRHACEHFANRERRFGCVTTPTKEPDKEVANV